MAVSNRQLREHGCTPKDWKPLFTASAEKKLPQIKKLELLIMNRINDGRLMNIREFRPYAAIDMALNVPFAQTTPTILQDLIASNAKPEDVLTRLKQWGFKPEDLFLQMTNKETGQAYWQLNPPTFFKVLVPLVKAYVTIRLAKLFNDRNQSPLFKYEPLQSNAENRILCDVLTYVVQIITADYGYSVELNQAIRQALTYSFCLMFPREVWDAQYQLNADGKKELQKEGIRYCSPHPSRVFWDLHFNISSFNTDTGCEYAGYWKVVSYGEILDNPLYWNRRSIGYGTSSGVDWLDPAITSSFFQEIYPCQLQFPTGVIGNESSREANCAFYASAERDKAVYQTDLWMKIIPAKYKMGTYKFPVWVRFIVASDNTVLYAEPCCYSPIIFFGYDTNQLDSRNASLALEVLPFQDVVGNILSQILLTCKKNLANANFYDKNIINREDIDRLKNGGELLLRSLNFVEFDSMKNNRAGLDVKQAIHSVEFPYSDVTPLFNSLNTVLSILERLLQLSSQEAGQAASHQQSAEELKQIGGNTSNRVQYTGTFIDDAIDAWKRQLHDGAQAYMDDEVEAMVPSDIPDVEEHLETLGFKVSGMVKGEGKLKVKGSKKALKLDAIASCGKGPDRKNDTQTAQIMMQAFTAVASNQLLAQTVGPKTLLKILTQAAILGGADKDFKLRPDQQAQLDQLQQLAQQIQQAAVKQIEADVTKPVADEIAKMQQQIQQVEQILSKLVPQGQPQPTAPAPQPNVAPNPAPAPIAAPTAGVVPAPGQ